MNNTKIAIIGMSAHLPSASNINEYWELLSKPRCGLTVFSRNKLIKAGISKHLINNPNYVPVKGYIDIKNLFDAEAFNIKEKEAFELDPQFRVFLELSDQALFSAGYTATKRNHYIIGVYATGSNLSNRSDLCDAFSNNRFGKYIHAHPSFIPMYTAYKLNLRGPAISIQSACSSSLVAVIQACEGLKSGFCDMAIAGGISISYPLVSGYLYEDGFIYSKTGQCRPFTTENSGIVPSDGGGTVLLKTLEKALKDGDTIYSVIDGYHINNDGSNKIGYPAPGYDGQCQVITNAIKRSGVLSRQISYIETHGTGTKLGDQVEIDALKSIFSQSQCYIGSVKSSIGHTDVAAGISGLLKVALSFYNGFLPPMYGISKENLIGSDILGQTLNVLSSTLDWSSVSQKNHYAGVSAFGIGGTNAHVILSAYQQSEPHRVPIKKYPNKKSYWPQRRMSRLHEKLAKQNDVLALKTKIKEVFCSFFHEENLSEEANLLDYGLDSIGSVDLAILIQQSIGFELSPQKILALNSIAHITNCICKKVTRGVRLIKLKDGLPSLPIIVFIHPGHGEATEYLNFIKFISLKNKIYAIENNIFNDLICPPTSIKQMAKKYMNLLLSTFSKQEKKFILSGWSFGGNVAVAMAEQLQNTKKVKHLILFDSWLKHTTAFNDKTAFQRLFQAKIKVNPKLQYIQNWIQLHWGRAKLLSRYLNNNKIDIPCCLFKASKLEPEYQEINNASNYWETVFGNKLSVYDLNTTHSTIFSQNSLENTVKIFQTVLEKINEQ
jgi:3-oxoacyl-(acyl-carrier-protein) synthase/acyl carrier protein